MVVCKSVPKNWIHSWRKSVSERKFAFCDKVQECAVHMFWLKNAVSCCPHPVTWMWSLHYGEVETFACRSNHKVVNFGKLFLCQFLSDTWKVWHEACLTPKKSGSKKVKKKYKHARRSKNKKKHEGDVFDRHRGCQQICFDECFDICLLNMYQKHPLIGQNCTWMLKKRFCKYLSSVLDAAGWSNIWFISSLSFSMCCIGF